MSRFHAEMHLKSATRTKLFNGKSYIKKLHNRLQLQMPLHVPAQFRTVEFEVEIVINLTKLIQESSYIVLEATSKQKTLKQTIYFLKAVEFALLLTFKLTLLWLYFRKSCKTTHFRKPTEASQNTPPFILIWPPITKCFPFKNMKSLCFFGGSFFKNKKKLLIFGIFNESDICAKVYHI